jgi:hypothetical protein
MPAGSEYRQESGRKRQGTTERKWRGMSRNIACFTGLQLGVPVLAEPG